MNGYLGKKKSEYLNTIKYIVFFSIYICAYYLWCDIIFLDLKKKEKITFIIYMVDFESVSDLILDAQDKIIESLATHTDSAYKVENVSDGDTLKRANYYWSGKVIEKGGVHFIKKTGEITPYVHSFFFSKVKSILTIIIRFIKEIVKEVKGDVPFEIKSDVYHVTGLSLILHPSNPHVPTMHMNVRYFEVGDIWWFGGGIDISPSYFKTEDVCKDSFTNILSLYFLIFSMTD